MITTFGEILLRLNTIDFNRFSQSNAFSASFGGSEANVAGSLAFLGHQTQLITRFPENEIADAAIQNLVQHRVGTENILFGGNRIGIQFIESGKGHRESIDLFDRLGSSMTELQPGMIDWKKAFTDTHWFHWSGITPAISKSAAEVCLEGIKIASELGITISVDLNFRSQLWKNEPNRGEILSEMIQYCDIIFGGIDAPENFFGIIPEDRNSTKGELLETDLISISEQVLKKFKKAQLFSSSLRWIKNTNHNQLQGMIFSRKGAELYLASVYDIPGIVDRNGTGDAFMAGLIHGILTMEGDLQNIVNFATASSVLKHYIHGDINISSINEINRLSSK